MPDGPAALEEAYNAVEDIVSEVEQYVKVRVLYNRLLFSFVVHVYVFFCECTSLLCRPCSGLAAVPVLVGHASGEHLQPSG